MYRWSKSPESAVVTLRFRVPAAITYPTAEVSTDEPPAYSWIAMQADEPGTPAPVNVAVTVLAPALIPNATNVPPKCPEPGA